MRLPVTFFAAICLALIPGLAVAESALPGIQFDTMPVGCTIHTLARDGVGMAEVFVGKSGRGYQTKRWLTKGPDLKSPMLVFTNTYDSNGFLVKVAVFDGSWDRYVPFNCAVHQSDCTYTLQKSDGTKKLYIGKAVRNGHKVRLSGGFEGEAPFKNSFIELGPFNNIVKSRGGTTNFKVTAYENCGLE